MTTRAIVADLRFTLTRERLWPNSRTMNRCGCRHKPETSP